MKKYIIILFLLFPLIVFPQRNDSQAAVFNIASGTVLGGVGAIINKDSGEKFHKVLLKGMAQGAVGGYVVFESKRLLRKFNGSQDYSYVWPSKILNSAGNSMILNAASNRNLWERWYLNIGFNHIEYDLRAERKIKYRILPFALIGATKGFIDGNLDAGESIRTGHLWFRVNDLRNDAAVSVNSIRYREEAYDSNPAILVHEIIHVYQYEGYFALNSFVDKPIAKYGENSNIFNWYNRIFYTDISYPFSQGLDRMEELFGNTYPDNFHEKEAIYYADR